MTLMIFDINENKKKCVNMSSNKVKTCLSAWCKHVCDHGVSSEHAFKHCVSISLTKRKALLTLFPRGGGYMIPPLTEMIIAS